MTTLTQEDQFADYERREIHGKRVWVPQPVRIDNRYFVERQEIIEKALATWLVLDGMPPMSFRFYGPSGIGKNAAVYTLARTLHKDLYIVGGHQGLGPDDIACTPVMTSGKEVVYVASPLFGAMLRGGICFFDEIGKAPTCALDPLASVLDDRRTLTSVAAGIHLRAHPEFLFCAALQEEEENGVGLPAFLDKRTRPAIRVGYPSRETLERFLRTQFSTTPDVWLTAFVKEFREKDICPGDAVKLLRYAFSLAVREGKIDVSPEEATAYLRRACPDMKRPEDQTAPSGTGMGKHDNGERKSKAAAKPRIVLQ